MNLNNKYQNFNGINNIFFRVFFFEDKHVMIICTISQRSVE